MISKKLVACVIVILLSSGFVRMVEAAHNEVHTLPATNITKNSATLHGTVGPDAPQLPDCVCPCGASFCLLDAYGAHVRGFGTVDPGESFQSFSGTWENLTPGTTYGFCACIYVFYTGSTACCDYTWAEVLHFTTLPADRPKVSTEAATEIGDTSATLWGRIDDDGGEPCRYKFRWRKAGDSYYTETDWAGSVTTGVPFSVAISGLAPVSTYYFSAQACNSAGEGEWGGELSFVTLGYTLIVSSSTGGHVSVPGEGPFSYARGRSVQVTATSDLNYHFVNWTGTAVDAGKVANPSSASTTVTMDADYTLQANFAIDRYWVIISATPGGSVSLPGQGSFSYDYGTWVNLLASPDAGYRFVNWTGTGAPRVVPRLPNGDKILVDADYTLVANFSETAPICGDGRCDPGEDRSSCPGDCPDKPPVASFTYLPDKPLAGEKVRLDASNSKDPDGRIMSYLWDYGDGTGEGTTSPVVEHTFKTPGEYKVTLMVTDNDGQTGTVTSTITVITVTRGQFMIAFDDGPVPENTEKILDALKNIKVDGEPVRAGFFMVGVGCCEDAICYCLSPNQLPSMGSVRSNPDLVRMVAQAGHIIGVHTQHHPWFGEWSLDDIKREISTCLEEIRKAAPGANITTFRAPYLCAVPNVVAAAKALDLQIIPGVGENEDLSVDEGGRQWTKARSLIESWDKGYPCVLTFHDASPDTPGNIADIVAYLEKEGFALVHFDPDRIPDEVQTIHTLSGIAHCPVDLVVTDPAGLVLSKEQKEIPDAIYEELDVDGDGDLEDSFLVPDARLGQY